ncbi:MAG: methyltransferase, TIGR04325 family [Vicinamibacterales bacterium]
MSSPGQFHGIYPDFAAALSAVPESSPVGYDRDEMATLYQERLDRVFPCDYPIMFWLGRNLKPGLKIFDVGGHVGLSFYGYRDRLPLPADAVWMVQDLPRIVNAGVALARDRGDLRLTFTEHLNDADGADILIASGSLQYIESPLASVLAAITTRPPVLLLHKLPLTDGPSFVTLQNTVHSFNPYRVFNRTEFVRSFAAVGYQLVDSWDDNQRSCLLPYAPERSVPHYTGLCLRRDEF